MVVLFISENIYHGHSVRNFFSKLSLSPDNKYIASTDSDDKIFIWKIRSPGKPISMLSGNPEMLKGLSDISWCPEDHLKVNTIQIFIIMCILHLNKCKFILSWPHLLIILRHGFGRCHWPMKILHHPKTTPIKTGILRKLAPQNVYVLFLQNVNRILR